MRKILITLFLLFLAWCAYISAAGEKHYFNASPVLPNVTTEMMTPGFWIGRLNAPDEVVMTPGEIEMLNRDIALLNLREDIASFCDTYNGQELRDSIGEQIKEIICARYFMRDGRRPKKEFFVAIEKNISLENMPDKRGVQFAIVVNNCDQRLLPVKEMLTKKPFDVDFDELQNSALGINAPIAVLWQSADKLWSYAVAPSSSGWVLTRNLAWCAHDTIKKMHTRDFVVITEPKADIYLDKERKNFYGFARMGTCFEIKNFLDDIVEIMLPLRDENAQLKLVSGYIRTKDAHRGYLPYTARMVIEQAFEMLNAPYGWGGVNGEQDCSQFLQEIFSVFGIILPRNSSAQAKVGRFVGAFDKKTPVSFKVRVLDALAVPGITLLRFDGHVGLYLGATQGHHFMIHETHGYEERWLWVSQARILNRVVVSDLLLGKNSRKGSLLERLLNVRNVCE